MYLPRLVVYKKAYDTSQEDLTVPTPHVQYPIQVAFSEK